MTAKKNAQPQAVLSKRKSLAHRIARDWQLYLIVLIPLAYLLIFCYGPMYGVQIAFRDYSPRLGIIGSPWVGWKWFLKFLGEHRSQKASDGGNLPGRGGIRPFGILSAASVQTNGFVVE